MSTQQTNNSVMGERPANRRQETYKHLDDPMRPGGLTLGQWATVAATTLAAITFGLYVSPFSTPVTIGLSVFFAGLPGAAAKAAGGFELSVVDSTRAIWRWARGTKHYLPGPGTPQDGYLVIKPPTDEMRSTARRPTQGSGARLEEVWDR
ncbi:MAG: hypothetical protein ACLGI7_02225 [Gammaproteobacteria bacterium]